MTKIIERFGKHIAVRVEYFIPIKFAMKFISEILFEADLLLDRHSNIMACECKLDSTQQFQQEPTQQHISHNNTTSVLHIEPNRKIPKQWCQQGRQQHAQQL